MSDGEWDGMSEASTDLVRDERPDHTQKIAKLEEENRNFNEELKTKKRKIEEQEEEIKTIKKENIFLKTHIKQNENVFTPHKWMKEEIAEVRLSNEKLSDKTMDVYKAIWDMEQSRLQSTNGSERRQLTEEIEKLEDLCEKISKDVKTVNEESIQEITTHYIKAMATPKSKVETNSIDRFLGKYISTTTETYYKAFSIEKAGNGYYQFRFTFQDGSKGMGTKWIPDNVDRTGNKVWTDGLVLYFEANGKTVTYELCQLGLKRDGFLYVRA